MADAAALLQTLKKTFEGDDLTKCQEQLAQLKLLAFSSLKVSGALTSTGSAGATAERQLAREMLELACFLAIRQKDVQSLERQVSQLKMYTTGQQDIKSEQTYHILGLYLLFLLGADRIGDFHTELELISVDDHENKYIKQSINLERHIMEGNYAKILEAKKDVPEKYYDFLMGRLEEMVRVKIGASLERSYEYLPAKEAAKMLMLPDVGKLQEFVMAENEKKAREAEDQPMADDTPSLSRRIPRSICRWEVDVANGRLNFRRDEEKKRAAIWEDMMINTIGYATDLERIV